MQKTLSIACAALFLGLTSCSKSFDLDTPLFDKTETQTAASVAYIKTGEFDLAKSISPLQVTHNASTVTEFTAQERYVYLSKPVDQDVTVTVALATSEASIASFTSSLSTNPGYKVAPEGYAKLSTTTVTIPKGQTKSSSAITISVGDKYAEISAANAATEYYVIPVQVSAVSGSSTVGVSQDYGTYFIPVKKSFQNIGYYTRGPQGTALASTDVTYEVSTAYSSSYGKGNLYDGDASSAWYAQFADSSPWVSGILTSGTKKFTAIHFQGTNGSMNAEQIEIFTTQDGTTWTSQGVLSASYLNQESSATVRFLNPIEAKGVKILGINYSFGYFGIGELTFYAEN